MAIAINESKHEVRIQIADENNVVSDIVCAPGATCEVPDYLVVVQRPGARTLLDTTTNGAMKVVSEVVKPVAESEIKHEAAPAKKGK